MWTRFMSIFVLVVVCAGPLEGGVRVSGVVSSSLTDPVSGRDYAVVDIDASTLPGRDITYAELGFDSQLPTGTELQLWISEDHETIPWRAGQEPVAIWELTSRRNARHVRYAITDIIFAIKNGATRRIFLTARNGDEGTEVSFPSPGRLNLLFHTR